MFVAVQQGSTGTFSPTKDYYLKGKRESYQLNFGKTTIGRQSDSNIRIPFRCVDLMQCVITRDESGITLQNLAPNTCTQFQNFPMSYREERTLKEGDSIRIGLTHKHQYLDFKVCCGKPPPDPNVQKIEPVKTEEKADDSSDTIPYDPSNPPLVALICLDSDSDKSDTMYFKAPFSQIAINGIKHTLGVLEPPVLNPEPSTSAIIPDSNRLSPKEVTSTPPTNKDAANEQKSVPCEDIASSFNSKEPVEISENEPKSESDRKSESEPKLNVSHETSEGCFGLKDLNSDELNSTPPVSSSDDETVNLPAKKRHVILSDKESGSSLAPDDNDSMSTEVLDNNKPESDEETEVLTELNENDSDAEESDDNSQEQFYAQVRDSKRTCKPSQESSLESSPESTKSSSSSDNEPLRKKLPSRKRKRIKEVMWPSIKERLHKTHSTYRKINQLCDE